MKTDCAIAFTSARNRAIGLLQALSDVESDVFSAVKSSHTHKATEATGACCCNRSGVINRLRQQYATPFTESETSPRPLNNLNCIQFAP